MVVFFVLFGLVEPGQWFNYEKTLMLAFISSPLFMGCVFLVWLLYAVKALLYVSSQISVPNQQFLFYSSNALNTRRQFKTWFIIQGVILLPVIIYGAIAVFAGIWYHYYQQALIIMLYLIALVVSGAIVYSSQVNSLVAGSKQTLMLKMSSRWRKPFFSLFIYYVLNSMKVSYLLTKALSWIIITAVFYLFADVSHDLRVAGIAVLSIVTAHTVLIYRYHNFENTYLAFARNMPYTFVQCFINIGIVYLLLLLPEAIWLFSRFNPVPATTLIVLGLSITLLFHSLIYAIGLTMDKYLQWVLGLFIILFWLVMFNLMWVLSIFCLLISFGIFYRGYYEAELNSE